MYINEDHCVICGDYVPEGRMVCPKCEAEANMKHYKQKKGKLEVWEDKRKRTVRRGKVRLEEMEEE